MDEMRALFDFERDRVLASDLLHSDPERRRALCPRELLTSGLINGLKIAFPTF